MKNQTAIDQQTKLNIPQNTAHTKFTNITRKEAELGFSRLWVDIGKRLQIINQKNLKMKFSFSIQQKGSKAIFISLCHLRNILDVASHQR